MGGAVHTLGGTTHFLGESILHLLSTEDLGETLLLGDLLHLLRDLDYFSLEWPFEADLNLFSLDFPHLLGELEFLLFDLLFLLDDFSFDLPHFEPDFKRFSADFSHFLGDLDFLLFDLLLLLHDFSSFEGFSELFSGLPPQTLGG